jgi:hypothetical protein
MNALTAAKLGLGTVTHFYGHFESLLKDYVVQPWPDQMNYNDEQWRFRPGRAPLGQDPRARQPEWKAYLEAHLKLGTSSIRR